MRFALVAALAALAPAALGPAAAQTISTGSGTVEGLPLGARNGVTTLEVADGRLFVGPRLLVVEPSGATDFLADDGAFDPPTAPETRVFSLDALPGGRIVVGLGFTDENADAEEPVPTAAGFAVSDDGGATWRYRSAPLDAASTETVQYGVSTLAAVPIFAPGDSPPYGVAADPATGALYSANAFAGLRSSVDEGVTWQRVVLPPDTARTISPDFTYGFPYAPAGTCIDQCGTSAPVISQFGFNFVAYSVLVDEAGDVWAGTLAGLNRSSDLDPATGDGSWVRYETDIVRPSPVGGFCIDVEARPIADARDEVWAACWPSGRSPDLAPNAADERFGISAWRGDDVDGEPIFETLLLGQRVYDLAFDGETAYAAGQNGLFTSTDGGAEWVVTRVFRGEDGRPLALRPGTRVFSVAVTDGANAALWVGTGDGLLKSTNGGVTWTLFRAAVPTDPATPSDETPTVEAYAYPNPFSPRSDRLVRVRVDLDEASDVRLRILDFAMNTVRDINAGSRPAGANEILWEGTADDGTRIANGTYLYVVTAGGQTLTGKILVLD